MPLISSGLESSKFNGFTRLWNSHPFSCVPMMPSCLGIGGTRTRIFRQFCAQCASSEFGKLNYTKRILISPPNPPDSHAQRIKLGEEGFWRVWLNEQNEWIYRHLNVAQDRMIELVKQTDEVSDLAGRALRQAGRELLLAQSSDWPFIIRTGYSPQYATGRLRAHLGQFTSLYEQIKSGCIDEPQLAQVEQRDNLFPSLDWRHWH